MLRFSLCVALATLAVPATASAAGFGELPFTPVSGEAGCVRATGAPGEIVRLTATGAELQTATPAGFTNPVEVPAPAPPQDCPAAAASSSGAGVIAFTTRPDQTAEVDVALREPGGAWGTAAKLATGKAIIGVTSAVSARGDAIVAWVRGNGSLDKPDYRIFAALRPAGGAFGAPVELPSENGASFPAVQVGMSDTGEAVAAWTTEPRLVSAFPYTIDTTVDADIAPPGGTFTAAGAVTTTSAGSRPALAVAPDGRALLVAYDGQAIHVAERPPAGKFAVVHSVAASDPLDVLVAAALRADGSAAVAWQSLSHPRAQALTRAGTGAFSTPVALAPPVTLPRQDPIETAIVRIFTSGFGPGGITVGSDQDAGDIRAAVTGDGRALFAFTGVSGDQRALWSAERAATVPLGGTAVAEQALGDPLRGPGAAAPVLLSGGAPAVAWADNAGEFLIPKGGRLRLAVEGVATAADPAPPTVTVGKPLKSALGVTDRLELPVHCSAACEVLGSVEGNDASGRAERDTAGTTTLSIAGDSAIAPAHPGTVKVRVLAGAPGARTPVATTVSVKLRRTAVRGLPKLLDVRAKRNGKNGVTVSVRLAKPVTASDLIVVGTRTSSRDAEPIAFNDAGSQKKTTHVTLTVEPGKGVKFVTVAWAPDGFDVTRLKTVKVG